MIKAIILAAGRGSRLLQLTDDRPKCMVELSGRPLLGWQMRAIRGAGLEVGCVVGGYRVDMLRGVGVPVVENADWRTTNMVASLCRALEEMPPEASLVVSYSDIVYPPDHVRALLGKTGDIVLTYDRQWLDLWRRRFSDPLSDAESFRIRDGRITEIGGKEESAESIQGQFMGLFKFSPAGRELVGEYLSRSADAVSSLDMTALFRRLLREGADIQGAPVDGGWCEIDSQDDLRVAEELVAEGRITFNDEKEPL